MAVFRANRGRRGAVAYLARRGVFGAPREMAPETRQAERRRGTTENNSGVMIPRGGNTAPPTGNGRGGIAERGTGETE